MLEWNVIINLGNDQLKTKQEIKIVEEQDSHTVSK